MRPLQLKLKGINSYREEQVIDFETLTSQGLFGIFGPTGSGKSTILDAMTLALYAKLPRDTKNFINTNETTASVSFLFSITTDRTRKYLAERSFRYHNNTYTSTVRNTTGRLIVCDGENETVLADKPTEVTAECIVYSVSPVKILCAPLFFLRDSSANFYILRIKNAALCFSVFSILKNTESNSPIKLAEQNKNKNFF